MAYGISGLLYGFFALLVVTWNIERTSPNVQAIVRANWHWLEVSALEEQAAVLSGNAVMRGAGLFVRPISFQHLEYIGSDRFTNVVEGQVICLMTEWVFDFDADLFNTQ